MDANMTLKKDHNRCPKNASTAEARLRSLIRTHGVVRTCIRAVLIACVQAIGLYGSELGLDSKEHSRREDLQHPLMCQARSTWGVLPTTPRAVFMCD